MVWNCRLGYDILYVYKRRRLEPAQEWEALFFDMYYYWEYILFMLPAMLLAMWAQFSVSSTFKKYNGIGNLRGMTGRDAALMVLRQNDLYQVEVVQTPGRLTDHFDPKANVIRLSESVYHSASVGAVGVAAHEAGHALQYAQGYGPIRFRMAIIPVCNIGSALSPWLLMLGLLFNNVNLYFAGIIAFSLVTLFQLATLPVEFNASRRAVQILESSGELTREELDGAKKVLRAAAMTYVAALFTSFMQLLYYISRMNRRRN